MLTRNVLVHRRETRTRVRLGHGQPARAAVPGHVTQKRHRPRHILCEGLVSRQRGVNTRTRSPTTLLPGSSTRLAGPTPSAASTSPTSLRTMTPPLTLTSTAAMQMLPLTAATSFEHRGPQCLLTLIRSTCPPPPRSVPSACVLVCSLYYKPSVNTGVNTSMHQW